MKIGSYLLIVLFALSYFPASGQDWERHVSVKGNFSVMINGDFRESSREVEDPVFGKLELNQYAHADSTDMGVMLYTIFYTDYPQDLVHQDSTDLLKEFFLATAESAAYSVAGNLIYSDEIHNFACPGYTWRIHYNVGDAVIRSRAYLCCSRLYILSVANLAEGVSTDNIFKFFDSFSLISPCVN